MNTDELEIKLDRILQSAIVIMINHDLGRAGLDTSKAVKALVSFIEEREKEKDESIYYLTAEMKAKTKEVESWVIAYEELQSPSGEDELWSEVVKITQGGFHIENTFKERIIKELKELFIIKHK